MNRQLLLENLKKSDIFKWYKRRFKETKITDYHQSVLVGQSIDEHIEQLFASERPFMISRLGSYELKILEANHKEHIYQEKHRHSIKNNAGLFPAEDHHLDRFAELYFEKIGDIDLLGIWFNAFENIVSKEYCPDAKLTELRNLEPYFSDSPWSYHLRGKKVLVIHPFTSSIESQYRRREKLFEDDRVLPEFELITYQAVQSMGGNSDFDSWFEALRHMKEEIAKIEFDIAIIGAGAYGLPLASFVKEMGKKALHLGGATQMLFGVYGRRWEQRADFQSIINEHWIRPEADERPKNADSVENACYW